MKGRKTERLSWSRNHTPDVRKVSVGGLLLRSLHFPYTDLLLKKDVQSRAGALSSAFHPFKRTYDYLCPLIDSLPHAFDFSPFFQPVNNHTNIIVFKACLIFERNGINGSFSIFDDIKDCIAG